MYTFVHPIHGDVTHGLTAVEVAHEIICIHGAPYELREGTPVNGLKKFDLYQVRLALPVEFADALLPVGDQHDNPISAYARSKAEAWPVIAEKVIKAGFVPIMTDQEFFHREYEAGRV